MLAFIVPASLGIAMMPMVATNFGARRFDRIDQCRTFAVRFAFWFEVGMALLFFLAAPWLADFFSTDPKVREIMVLYLRLIPFGFGLMEIHRYAGFFFTGCKRPSVSAWLNGLRVLGLLIPLSLFALWLRSLPLLFLARLAADVIAGGIGLLMMGRLTRQLRRDGKAPGRAEPTPEEPVSPCPPTD